MTVQQRRAWQNAATNYSVRNRVGELFTLNGFQLFMRLNLHNAHIIIPPTPDVPAVLSTLSYVGAFYWGTTPGYRTGFWAPTADVTTNLTVSVTLGRSFTTETTAPIAEWKLSENAFWANFPYGWWACSLAFENLWTPPMIDFEIVGVRYQLSRADRLPAPLIACTGVYRTIG
jgi:hypothetical protein